MDTEIRSITYNKNKPLFRMKSPYIKPYSSKDYDNILLDELYKREPGLRSVLNLAPKNTNFKRRLVKVRCNSIKANTTSCIPGWHLDAPLNPVHKHKRNIYHMFIIGPTTVFLDSAISLPYYGNQVYSKNHIPDNIKEYSLIEGCWNTYSELDWHRGVYVKEETPRLLIRITDTNYILKKKQ